MRYYSENHKKAVIQKLIENGLSLRQFAEQESVSLSTLYGWRDKYLEVGFDLEKNINSDEWSAEQQFSMVLETLALSEMELREYCREKGLYPEPVKA